jgi:hypothetical protein
MSRYVQVKTELRSLAEVEEGLAALGLRPTRADYPRGLSLAGSIECAGEPVDLRLPAGSAGSVEDFGWRVGTDGTLTLVCGEPDREHLDSALLAPLRAAIAANQARAAAKAAGLEVEEELDVDGTLRLKLRRS